MSLHSLRVCFTVAHKEVLEIIRDWRTIVAMLVVPLILLPVIFVALPLFLAGEMNELESQNLTIAIEISYDSELPVGLVNQMSSSNFTVHLEPLWVDSDLSLPGEDEQRLREGVRNGTLHAILRLAPTETNSNESWEYAILYDSTNERSREAANRLKNDISAWESEVIESNLEETGLSVEEAMDPISWSGAESDADVATSSEFTGFTLSMMIPLMVALWVASFAMQPAIDMTAGERERGTMESLLSTSASRFELLFGKWIAVVIIVLVVVSFQSIWLIGGFLLLFPSGIFALPDLTITAIAALLLAILLYAISVVAIELALAVRAHSVKEAGTTLAPLMLAFIAPPLFALFVNLEGIELWWFAAPVLNICLAMREALLGIEEPTHILIWVTSSLLYTLLAVWWASRQFNREDLVESIS